ncbi:hypothetical protein GTQ43_20870 [Nostoc sp. KVJ3]|uniref:hypothetical protein n=1 Tax=Nostoc sp. KVJ3 TaxID=457945 RepID=UPI00223842F5|nr:hypothetical protein [Nostoc sp. KVJ3]MCW5315622.1 hypothetical protein [Nostoc sp. KVJ3]MCW5316178.1 hypothetical protein [Nostoc sp. KVJ3]
MDAITESLKWLLLAETSLARAIEVSDLSKVDTLILQGILQSVSYQSQVIERVIGYKSRS